jgi:hypothetical protein
VSIHQTSPSLPDTVVNACDRFVLPNISTVGDFKAGFYTEPRGSGQYYSPGTAIYDSITLYAFSGSEGCEMERKYEIHMGASSVFHMRATNFCPYFLFCYDARVYPSDLGLSRLIESTNSFVFYGYFEPKANADSLWLTDSEGCLFSAEDTIRKSGSYTVFSQFGACITHHDF